MANEDMAGVFIGGGSIRHVVSGGEIFLNADDVAKVLFSAGGALGIVALASDDKANGGTALGLLHVATKIEELRSELLKREAEALVGQLEMDFPDTNIED